MDLPAAPSVGWWWGTNRQDGPYYAGRAHVVHPDQPTTALCGLPVDTVWRLRPSEPPHLCPECCVLALAASYPPFSAPPLASTRTVGTDWFTPPRTQAEKTAVITAVGMDDP